MDSSWNHSDQPSKCFIRIVFRSEAGATFERLREGFATLVDPFQIEWVLNSRTSRTKKLYSVLTAAIASAMRI